MVSSVSSSATTVPTTTATSSTGTSTANANAGAGSQIINALGAGGGIDIQTLATSLTNATFASDQSLLSTRTNAAQATVSSVGRIMSTVDSFATSVTALGDPKSFQRQPTTSDATKVDISFAQGTAPETFSASVSVNALGSTSNVLFAPVADLNASMLGADANRTLTLKAGSAGTPGATLATVDLSAANTITQVRDAINKVSGFTATIVQGGSASAPAYYLSVSHGTGTANQFFPKITTTNAGVTTDAAGTGLTATGAKVTAGTDASITVDGVTILSPTNKFNSVLPDVEITATGLTGPTPVTIGSTTDPNALTNALSTLLAGYNQLYSTIQGEATQDSDPTKRGALANNSAARDLLNQLSRFSTQPISGFDGKSHSLAEIGVTTQTDGTLTVDPTAFAKILKSNPAIVEAVLASKQSVSDRQISLQGASAATVPGIYTITKNGPSDWSIGTSGGTYNNGLLMGAAGTPADGMALQIASGLNRSAPVGYTATVNYSKGLIQRFSEMLANAKLASSPIETTLKSANSALTKISTDQSKLNDKMTATQQRYVTQFTAMQSLLSQNKSTQTSLTNMMTAWTYSMKGG